MTQNSKPNVVLIYADDLGYGDLSCYGASLVKTPNIDRLAAEGRTFSDAHSASAVCTPSRYALLTGSYPFRQNLWGPHPPRAPLQIPPDTFTLPRLFKTQGYATACIGKWHLGFTEGEHDYNKPLKPGPLELGFNYYFGIPQVNSGPPFVYVENHEVVGYDPKDPFVEGEPPPTQDFPEKNLKPILGGAKAAHALYKDEEIATTLTRWATEWIRSREDEPFFLYLSTTNIHHPFTPHPSFQGASQCGRYGDFIHELDWVVGEVTRALEERGVLDSTLIIFTSDNGGMFNDGGKDAWKAGHAMNGDLLGFKFGAWEGGHRIPLIARWPGRIPAGSSSEQLFCQTDFLHTFATLFGVELTDEQGIDSFDQLAAFTKDKSESARDHVVLAPRSPTHLTLREKNWIYIDGQGDGGFESDRGGPLAIALSGRPNSDITPDGRIRKDAPESQLYDLSADLAQSRNVLRDHPNRAREMKQRLHALVGSSKTRP